ncbi:hypothetical protein PR003_g11159 [Phytophthora rubi]|uniref:Uncharacterized protein n=1 Tax=Phytophthora rubi TaxID=129364 RepID=A0A6A3KTY4_9STRA|nr:hypothetical protein PR001_g16070 [Phytophthora rubi]KAE9028430.1 hypothetical protein PR002_g10397 [Phytophthora rubi]KAE9339136.1 hypothetical protein PR003_g11159 [Phytophthora rubi]
MTALAYDFFRTLALLRGHVRVRVRVAPPFVADLAVLVDDFFFTVACLVVESLAFKTPSALLFVTDDFCLALTEDFIAGLSGDDTIPLWLKYQSAMFEVGRV